MISNTRRVTVAAAAIAAMATAACGSSSSGSDQAGASSGAGTKFSFVTGAPGEAQAITGQAIQNINKQFGYKGTWTKIEDSDLVVQGMAAGKFDIASGTTSAVMAAAQKGAPLTFVGEEELNDWTLTGQTAINGCSDLRGKRLGLQSAGGVSTALYKSWFKATCQASDAPKILYVAGSPNRAAGLKAKQLDVSMLEVPDVLKLPQETFHIIANFSKDIPYVKTTLYYGNNTFLQDNGELVTRLLAEVNRLHRQVQADPSQLAAIIRAQLPDEAKNADAIAKAGTDAALYPADVSVTLDELQKTATVYTDAGILQPGFDASKFLNTKLAADAAALAK